MSAALSDLAWSVLNIPEIVISGRVITKRRYHRARPTVYHVHYHQRLRTIRRPYAA